MTMHSFDRTSWPLEKQLTYAHYSKLIEQADPQECRQLAVQILGLWLQTQVLTSQLLSAAVKGEMGSTPATGAKLEPGSEERFMGDAGPYA